MRLPATIFCFCLLISVFPAQAQDSQEKPKQQAKELFEKAKAENNDRASQVRDMCQAAQLDSKNKKYADACNSYRTGLDHDDSVSLVSAIAAYKSHDLDKAESLAKLVSGYDDKLSAEAKLLLDRIESDKTMIQVRDAWAKGDFKSVVSLAQTIASPDSKAEANVYVNNVNLYRGYILQSQKLEKDNPNEAIRLLSLAKELSPNGPDNPAAKIAELQKAMMAKNAPAQPASAKTSATPAESSADIAKRVGKLISDARNAEKQGNSRDALNNYAMVLKLQPGNQDAQNNTNRIEQAIRSDPAAARGELVSAIRYFYLSQFDDAERALMDYLESPKTAQNPGVADFYLGAVLVERSMLQTPLAQWQGPSAEALSAFKEARKAKYKPVRDYLSPALLKVWDSTAQ